MPQAYPSIRELAVLQQGLQMVLSSLDADTVLHHILLIARNYFGATDSAVYLLDSSSKELVCHARSSSGATAPRLHVPVTKDTVAGWAAFTRAPLYIPDLTREPRHKTESAATLSVLALPLLVRDRVVGVLELNSDKAEAFPADVITLLSVFSGQAAIALENARLHSTDLRRVRQIEIINLIARSAAVAQDRQQFFTMLTDLLSDTFEGTMIAVVLCSSEGHFSVPAHTGTRGLDMQRFNMARQQGVIAEAFARHALALVADVKAQTSWPACFAESGSELCVPLISLGDVLGAIVLAHPRSNFFTPEDRTIAQAAADVCATAAKNVQLSEELRRIANLDPLTGVYNQRYLHTMLAQEISRSRRHGKEFGLIMLDVRKFRDINFTLGLEVGDGLLRRLAELLRSGVRNNDIVARYLGDRFALLLPEVNAEGMVAVLGKLQSALESIMVPYPTAASPLSASWAAAQYPTDATTEVELIKILTSRLETAKAQAAKGSA